MKTAALAAPQPPRTTSAQDRRTALAVISALLLLIPLSAGCLGVPDPLPSRPVAAAGIDRFAIVGEPVSLDGSASSSPNGATLVYTWSFADQPEGSELTDQDITPNGAAEAVVATFTPDATGRYVISLMVDDGVALSVGDFIAIDVEGEPERPIADAGEDQTVREGMAVYLDGSSSSHPEDAQLYYRWTLAGVPSLSSLTNAALVNPYTPYPTLIVDAGGVFTLSLVVTDGERESPPDYVFITVESGNSAPIADAGGDRAIEACSLVTLDGGSSYDIDRDPLTYAWSVLIAPLYSSVSSENLTTADAETSGFYADRTGNYVVQLSVSDGALTSAPEVVNLTAVPRSHNEPPTVTTGADVTLTDSVLCTGSGESAYCPDCPAVNLAVSGSGSIDPDGDPLTWAWSVEAGNAELSDPSRLSTSVDLRGAKAAPGATTVTTYRLKLTATDCPGDTGEDTLLISYSCIGKN